MKAFIHFLNRLEEKKIYYKLDKIRTESILVEIAVPRQQSEEREDDLTYGESL